MDNGTHHHQQVVQLTNTNPQQQINNKSPDMDNFLTIRLLMQGKVRINLRIFFHPFQCIYLGSW